MASSSTPEKTTKKSASERFVSLTDEDVERFVEPEANKNTQRKVHSDVALARFILETDHPSRRIIRQDESSI